MIAVEREIDLTLCMGTSLSGMNADRVVKIPCRKYCGLSENKNKCMGSVIINLQFTPLDQAGYCPIRVFAKIDDAMKLLMKHLGIEMRPIQVKEFKNNRITCPYNEDGNFDESKKMVLDLSKGSEVYICHPKASTYRKIGKVEGKDKLGNYMIQFKDRNRRLGKWWLGCIEAGKILQLPLVNCKPEFVSENKE